mmetsp:Transcript_94493/g.273159  ORF Transcript_94493/g.273159 Transcript_94493/m.273159 type:complete len:237 (+) Transcript_94493:178-888(+)
MHRCARERAMRTTIRRCCWARNSAGRPPRATGTRQSLRGPDGHAARSEDWEGRSVTNASPASKAWPPQRAAGPLTAQASPHKSGAEWARRGGGAAALWTSSTSTKVFLTTKAGATRRASIFGSGSSEASHRNDCMSGAPTPRAGTATMALTPSPPLSTEPSSVDTELRRAKPSHCIVAGGLANEESPECSSAANLACKALVCFRIACNSFSRRRCSVVVGLSSGAGHGLAGVAGVC